MSAAKGWGHLWDRVDKREDGCWIWTGAAYSKWGHSQVSVSGSVRVVHRFFYEVLVGPIPDGLHLDHLCRVPRCVNPDHLEPVAPGVNVLRGDGPTAQNARKQKCKRGHGFTEENTRRYRWGGKEWRACRTCERERARAKRAGSKL